MNRKMKFFLGFVIICAIIAITAVVVGNYVIASNKSTYSILVDVEASRLYLLKNDVLEKEYKCAGGKESTPSPIGTWRINSKGKWGEGFGGSWMRN